jgi:large subunit ribosomal protein L29
MKLNELRDKSEAELHTRERELTDQLFKLRFQKSTGNVESPTKIGQVRREIARIKTLLTERSQG